MRNHAQLRAVLPQRYPMLLVDRVLDLRPGQSIRTVKAVTATEPCYAGLPDGCPIAAYRFPPTLMIESLGQSAALLWLEDTEPVWDGSRLLMFVGARDYRFDGAAYPGDVMRHEVRLDSVLADTAFAHGTTWVDDRCIATVATLIATRRPAPGGMDARGLPTDHLGPEGT